MTSRQLYFQRQFDNLKVFWKKKLTKGKGGKSEVGEYRCYKDKSNVCYKTNMAELYFQLGIWGGGKWKWKGKKEEKVEEIKKK